MNRPLAIFGVGTLAELAHYYSVHEMGLEVKFFLVDDNYKTRETFLNLPVLCWSEFIYKYSYNNFYLFIAIGYSSLNNKAKLYNRIKDLRIEPINILSKSTFIAKNVKLGFNNFFMPGTVIEPNVVIKNNNVIWSNSTICHDTIIGSHNFIASNVTVGGEVKIGDRNFFGFSSTVIQQKLIGSDTLIGAQSLVIDNLESLTHYQGIPAKKFKTLNPELGVCVD